MKWNKFQIKAMLAAAVVAVTCAATAATAFAAAPMDFDNGAFETKVFPTAGMNADGTMRPRGGNHYIHYRFFTPAMFKDWGQSDIGLGGGPYIYMATQTLIHENDGSPTWGACVTAKYGSSSNEWMLYDGYLTGAKVKSTKTRARRIHGYFEDAYNYYGPQDEHKIVKNDYIVDR